MHLGQINTLPLRVVQAEMEQGVLLGRTHFEFPHRRADGSIREVVVFSNKIEMLGKKTLFSAINDITERKLIAEVLRESEEQFRQLFQDVPSIAVQGYTPDGTVHYWNRASELLYGYSADEAIGRNLVDLLIPPEMRNDFEQAIRQMAATGQPIPASELSVRRKDGSRVSVFSSHTLVQVPGQAQKLFCIDIDLTERKRTEAALHENERTVRALINSADESIWLFGLEGEILTANETGARRLGMTVEEVVGKKWQEMVPAGLVVSRAQRIAEVLRADSPVCFADRRDGIYFDHTLYPVRDEGGTITSVACFSRDVTEAKLAEEALRKNEEQLRVLNNELEQRVEQRTLELQQAQKQYLHVEKLSAIGKLSASIAHEFNNPLQGIQSVLKGLRKRAILDEEDRELLEDAIEESDRIKNLIRNLEEFNRPSSSRKLLMDMHKAIDSVLLLYKSDFKGKRISVMLDYAAGLPQIQAVPDQIKQVLLNMLTNAADACHQSGGVITVSTRQVDKNTVAVAIKDTGIGIKPSDMELIFQPFYTTKPEVKGTGLGLSVSYGIIKNHQGEIRVESRVGEGATFTILLPIKGVESAA